MKRWLATDKSTGITWLWMDKPIKDQSIFIGDERGIQKINQLDVEFKLPTWEESPIEVEVIINLILNN